MPVYLSSYAQCKFRNLQKLQMSEPEQGSHVLMQVLSYPILHCHGEWEEQGAPLLDMFMEVFSVIT